MNLYNGFQRSVENFPNNTSVVVGNASYTYREMELLINKISNIIADLGTGNIGIYCYRSVSSYTGILSSLKTGRAYIPLNPKFPASRNSKIIQISECHALVVDNYSFQNLEFFELLNKDLVLIFPETDRHEIPDYIRTKFQFYSREDLIDQPPPSEISELPETAYIIFTSGSTGTPKGVAVTHTNVCTYVATTVDRYKIGPEDRFSHLSDITFDLSVHEMFVCWAGGASLYCIPESSLLAPAHFIRNHNITIWTSVPSMVRILEKLRLLKPNTFSSLRYSVFCGEPLPKKLAVAWQEAAPDSVLENLYGPTETTVGISYYQLPGKASEIAETNGIISIGTIFNNHEFCLINNHDLLVKEEGELCISGPQVTPGYYKNLQKTEESFVKFEGSRKQWYKTGDVVKLFKGKLYFQYRKDSQVKLRGYRIELGEIDAAISAITAADFVYTLPYSVENGIVEYLIAFLDESCRYDEKEVKNLLSAILPAYMIPKKIVYLKKLPLGLNGKIDRKEILKNYKESQNG